ncbi:hypothetical protein [Clostridium cylindrosporum]|uniref:DUF1573 domain-containing protein n=1 Tax=Clostridium cylindrosporum DSM 605 TaxID=1121307 RepID=A0A0J8D8P5_CLOCY|nr:hypothetical protein [Clostridium cylindrosporum]KMT22430.1 hypothetical protein CLCY_12c00130 [Clostridium cylindrosporum DSM 605]
MDNISISTFQDTVNEALVRHKSLIDIMTKISESSARINRAIAKSVTGCGCIELAAHKQSIPLDSSLDDASQILTHQVNGSICEHCREVLQDEIGNHFFYITSACNALNINLEDTLVKELDKIATLGKYSML